MRIVYVGGYENLHSYQKDRKLGLCSQPKLSLDFEGQCLTHASSIESHLLAFKPDGVTAADLRLGCCLPFGGRSEICRCDGTARIGCPVIHSWLSNTEMASVSVVREYGWLNPHPVTDVKNLCGLTRKDEKLYFSK